jgi:hypothetical protein
MLVDDIENEPEEGGFSATSRNMCRAPSYAGLVSAPPENPKPTLINNFLNDTSQT